MNYHIITSDEDSYIWDLILKHEGETFLTAKGLPYTYHRKIGRNGEPLSKLVIDRKEKTITRNTVILAYKRACELMEADGFVAGPKKLGCFGASYIYPVFVKLGVCKDTHQT